MQMIPVADTLAELPVEEVKKTLGTRSMYRAPKGVSYGESEKEVAMNIALANFTTLSFLPVEDQDMEWCSDGFSLVRRYELVDGSAGYFKPFQENGECDEDGFRNYGVTSLGAAINDANAYRMAQLFGGDFEALVPETVIREIEGALGSFQREVETDCVLSRDYFDSPELQSDYRCAAIFDFVIGNMDRHDENFLYGVEDTPNGTINRIRLIDNSFSFPRGREAYVNECTFADNRSPFGWADRSGFRIPEHELALTEDEIATLERVALGVEEWISSKTIGYHRGKSAIRRIRFLIDSAKLSSYSEYAYNY